jgi:hypothetical protein
MVARKARHGLSSLLTLGLLLLPAGVHAASTPQVQEIKPIAEAAADGAPEGFELQEVTVTTGKDAQGAVELVSAKYLGAGTRNEIRYMTFATDQAARSFIAAMEPDSCSPRGLAECATRLANTVVAGLSASTCPHPTPEMVTRAQTLLRFGAEKMGG